ncbi:methylmalonyl-CoA mutase family protein [Aegicerativicinus sediminis]|uniref:methylmalonyl-CoA mutase family protein n=1 Tax=Aegicerativicinus sediminis TaxID=2893202 RepID=UPI001E304652|nr:methylmalonyl-CoA mutase family protein [Aegicerativicinus sediminis]
MIEDTNHNLFAEFDEVSAKQWKQNIQFELKGKDYSDNLVWESPEGIHIKPFYNEEDLQKIILPKLKYPKHWRIQKTITIQSKFNADIILAKIEEGFESFRIILNGDNEALSIEELNKIPSKTPIFFEVQSSSKLTLNEKLGNFSVQFDPIAHLVKTGNWHQSLNSDFNNFKNIFKIFGALSVNIETYQNAGANLVQQLAYAMAHTKEYCDRIMEEKSPGVINFRVALGSNYFFEIAKLRALRWLWDSLATLYNWANCECIIHVVPSKRNKTIYDYNTNMLRTTTECMSGVLGGADTIENLPYDKLYHYENDFGDRLAKNQLLILKEESYFDAVSNATDGTYYIEQLTHQLATKALALFKEIEKSGGFLKQLKEGTIQKKIKEVANEQQAEFNDKKILSVGSNFQPNPKDRMVDTLDFFPFRTKEKRKTLIEPIVEKRLSEKIEKERLQQEKNNETH